MRPTLAHAGELVLVDKWGVRPFFSAAPSLQRNDIVLCDSHYRASYVIVKRVVGVGGDALLLRDRGAVVRVPAGHVWLEGDNPLDSHDSRAYGAIPAALVQGRVAACVWPPWSARVFTRGAAPGAGVLRNGSNAVVLPSGAEAALAGRAGALPWRRAGPRRRRRRRRWRLAQAKRAAACGARAVHCGAPRASRATRWRRQRGPRACSLTRSAAPAARRRHRRPQSSGERLVFIA
jgi:signal peptidase I